MSDVLLCRFLDERVDELRFVLLLTEYVGCFLTDADGDSHVSVSHRATTASATSPSWVLLILCHRLRYIWFERYSQHSQRPSF